MSKHAINIFNISIYKYLINQYNLNLNALIKYHGIYTRMDGYYSKEEMHYIAEVYTQQLLDIINSNLFSLFVPQKVRKEINKYITPIKSQLASKNYYQLIKNFTTIKNMIFVDVEYPE